MALKVLTLTMLYPNRVRPTQAVFVERRVREMAIYCEVRVVAPIGAFPGGRWLPAWRDLAALEGEEERYGLKVYHPRFLAPPGLLRDLRPWAYAIGVKSTLQRLQHQFAFEVIDAHFAYPDGVAAALLARWLRRPLVLTVRGSDLNWHSRFWLRRVQIRWALQRAARVIAVSQALKRAVVDLGTPPEQVVVVPNGIDTEQFFPRPRTAARQALGLPVEGRFVLFVGNLLPIKGLSHLLTAFAHLHQNHPDVRLLLVGEGPLRSELEQQARKLGIAESVHFLGARPHAQIPLWLAAAEVFCLPSLAEGYPNVVLETLACGRPVVASRVGGVPEIITDERYGLLVPPGQAEQLAAALTTALEKEWDEKTLVQRIAGQSWAEVGRAAVQQLEQAVAAWN
ncbi:MAG TPA: glycosyltransferase family 4 protein [Armatimonadetes bacterium]|nr:glycosyltransferase family 4 protein [Armatimonadota bacterium]